MVDPRRFIAVSLKLLALGLGAPGVAASAQSGTAVWRPREPGRYGVRRTGCGQGLRGLRVSPGEPPVDGARHPGSPCGRVGPPREDVVSCGRVGPPVSPGVPLWTGRASREPGGPLWKGRASPEPGVSADVQGLRRTPGPCRAAGPRWSPGGGRGAKPGPRPCWPPGQS